MADIDALIATGIKPPQSESITDQRLKLGELGEYNAAAQLNRVRSAQALQLAQHQQANQAALAAAMNPTAATVQTSTPAQVRAASVPAPADGFDSAPNSHPLINRSQDGATVGGATTLGGIGTQPNAGADPRPNLPAATSQSVPTGPDMSDGAIRARYVAYATRAGVPADLINENLKTLDSAAIAKENDLKVKKASADSRDTDIQTAAFSDAQGDPDATVQLMLKRGATPTAIDNFQNQITATRQHLATLSADELKNVQTGHDAMRGALKAFIAQESMLDKTNGWHDFIQQQVTSGHLSKEEAAAVSPTYPGDKVATNVMNSLATGTQLAKEEIENRTAKREDDALAETKKRDTAAEEDRKIPKTVVELEYAANDPAATQAKRDQAKAALAGTLKQQEALKLTINNNAPGSPGTPLAPQKAGDIPLTGNDFLRTLKPSDAARVQAIASGREAPPSMGGGAARINGPLIAAVEQYDPTWSKERSANRHNFLTATATGRNIANMNTAVVHLDQLHEAAKAMNNGTWRPGNSLYNYVASQFGDAVVTNYGSVMNALAGETASALKGNATDPEIAAVVRTLQSNMAPAQFEGVALAQLHVLGAKMQTANEQFHATNPDDPWNPVLPSARAIFNRYGFDPTAGPGPGRGGAGKITVKAGDGSLHPFDTEAQAQAFEKAVKAAGGSTSR